MKVTYNPEGKLQSFNDEPAVTYPDGTKSWYKNNKLHRDNGEPAIIGSDATSYWYIEGISLNKKQVELLKKINASEINRLPWLLNEDELLNSIIEKRLNEGN